MKRPKYRAVKEHKASFPYAMVANEGDEVSIGREDPEMPGWYWCRDKKGFEMWVPSTHLKIEGVRGTFTQDYNSVELDIAPGDFVQYLGEALGWAECLDAWWRYGWIPLSKLETHKSGD
jgi:hypothetical protein